MSLVGQSVNKSKWLTLMTGEAGGLQLNAQCSRNVRAVFIFSSMN